MPLTIEDHRQVMREFIELYKLSSCLWRVKSKEYYDRAKRGAAYKKLVEKLKEIEPAANKDAVVKKINNLRCNVRKEKKKHEQSVQSAATADDIYHPKLWYYHLFDFLNDQETPKESPEANLDSDEMSYEIHPAQETDNSHVDDEPNSPSYQNLSQIDNAGSSTGSDHVQCTPGQTKNFTSQLKLSKRRRSQNSLNNDALVSMQDHFKRPYTHEDRFDILGKSVAMKLREVDKRQSLIAEKIINDVIFEAELGNLSLEQGSSAFHSLWSTSNL
ncbi:hypothetical protein ABEB36_013405 [Hypothenemus hampei]|uniref:MADF domain-containing protein n=1 Tax=Hypothenemus hampei TaxID=57062 RepID=A0ABD1E853_HYPHA